VAPLRPVGNVRRAGRDRVEQVGVRLAGRADAVALLHHQDIDGPSEAGFRLGIDGLKHGVHAGPGAEIGTAASPDVVVEDSELGVG